MKRIAALLISLVLMGMVLSRINVLEFQTLTRQMNPFLLILALLLFIPQTLTHAQRWKVLIEKSAAIALTESVKLTLAANALNLLLPSRMGDLSKAYFAKKCGHLSLKRAMNAVFFEKYLDLAALGFFALCGVFWSFRWDLGMMLGFGFSVFVLSLFPILYLVNFRPWVEGPRFEKGLPAQVKNFLLDSQSYLDEIKGDQDRLVKIIGVSLFLWFLHLFQFYVIFKALHSGVSLFLVFRLVPLAILVGLLPVTVAGVGTRDSAMLYFFSPYESQTLIIGVGIFATLRYLIPGVCGLPFLHQYMVREEAAE